MPKFRHSGKKFVFFYKNPSSPSATAQALGEATSKILFFLFFAFPCKQQSIYIYITNHKSTPICHKPHLYITNDQICPKSTIYYKPHVQKYTLFQIHKFNKKTTPKAAHGDCEGWEAPACDPGDGPGGDGPTCDAGDPSTWFDAAPD